MDIVTHDADFPADHGRLTGAAALSSISPAQLSAHQANAQLSTGPRTQAGGARSSQNAVKSALSGHTVLLPTDGRDEYARFLADSKSNGNR